VTKVINHSKFTNSTINYFFQSFSNLPGKGDGSFFGRAGVGFGGHEGVNLVGREIVFDSQIGRQ
jgi:hypothetical protein